MNEQLTLLPGYLTAHLQLSLAALALGTSISIPLGIWLTRSGRGEGAALAAASVMQTLPSLALLAIMVPALAALGSLTRRVGVELSSIGFLPALLALALYSILPMLRGTVLGLRGVDAAVLEAARAVGMSPAQRLLRVELPLALPVLVGGVRTAAVWVVGTATLSTPVGATSLGNFIFSGLQTRSFDAVLVGCLAAAGLALLLDGTLAGLQRGLADRSRARTVLALTVLLGLIGYTAASARSGAPERAEAVVIGAKTFSEQYILSELLGLQITHATGLPCRILQSLGSTVAFDALRSGEIDVYVDYSGTIWATLMGRPGAPPARRRLLAEVEEFLWARHGITLAAALGFENRYALAMRREHAARLGVRRIGDLSTIAPRLEIGGDYEFFARQEWEALRRVYGLAFHRQRAMDSSLMYAALQAGEVDVISAFSTDGRIAAFDLILLEDERAVIPPYDAIVLVSRRLREQHPEALAALGGLRGRIDSARMRRLNFEVDQRGRTPADVARELFTTLHSAAADAAPGGSAHR
ncbi:MAG: ABC transporter permease/substrate-binding protein [Myxococcota bacterium]